MFKNKTIFTDEIKNLAINDYLKGMSYRSVAKKYKVDHKTVRYWVIKSGNKSRSNKEANLLAGKKLRGMRRSHGSEFKKRQEPWNKGTKGMTGGNKTSFSAGNHYSVSTEFKSGETSWNKGIPCTEETKRKICAALKGKLSGDKHPNWRGGLSEYSDTFDFSLKEKIRCRDKHKCRLCGKPQSDFERKLDCHHIDYDKKNCNDDNLISLCKSCHMTTNFNREYWECYFKEAIYCLDH